MNTELTEQDLETLSRYLDGELENHQEQALRERLLAEPALRAHYERLKAVDGRLREAFELPGVDRVPESVVSLVQGAATSQRGRMGWAMGLAATVFVAAGVVFNAEQSGQGEHMFARQDALVSPVLENTLSRGAGWDALRDGNRVRPLLSFPSAAGGWCREYLLDEAGSQYHGVACRTSGGEWVTAALAPVQHLDTAEGYRPAGAMTAEQVEAFIENNSADIPLGSAQEAELISRGWE